VYDKSYEQLRNDYVNISSHSRDSHFLVIYEVNDC
jgi:hypothetical protein